MKDKSKITREQFDEFRDGAPIPGPRPISGIFQDIVSHLTEIVRSEIRLARAEIRKDVAQVSRASLFLVVSAVFSICGLGFVLLAAVYALATTMPAWAAALIVGIGAGLIAAMFLWIGRNRMRQASLVPDKTIQSLQENVTWLKKQTK